MSRLLLDTSAYAAFFRGHPTAVAAVREASELALSPIVLGELRSGFLKGSRRARNERELAEFLASPRCTVPSVPCSPRIRMNPEPDLGGLGADVEEHQGAWRHVIEDV